MDTKTALQYLDHIITKLLENGNPEETTLAAMLSAVVGFTLDTPEERAVFHEAITASVRDRVMRFRAKEN